MWTTDRTATCVTPESLRNGAASFGRAAALGLGVPRAPLSALGLALGLALGACTGDTGPAGPQGPGGGGGGTDPDEPTPTAYAAGASVPALVLRLEGLSGASGVNGEFLVGDTPALDFALEKANGDPWPLEEIDEGQALVSGPSFNYQRVLPLEDVLARATKLSAGHYHFVFASAIPATFQPPYNDTTSFGFNGGELSGRNLLDGSYTLGLSFAWNYTVAGRPFQRVAEVTRDFLQGAGAGTLTPRAVTSVEHCNRCHGELQAHDGRYRLLTLCFLCHTSGSEDANLPDVAGGTPAVTIDSRVLFHKLHSGRYLPSVIGMSSRTNGNRNYETAPVPLRYVRGDGTLRDFSHAGFPAMPNRIAPMPRDTGYSSLTAAQQHDEDLQRSAPTKCALCHGDPDGAGPITTPPQASLTNVGSRRSCGGCHDDIDFTNSYRSNNQSMPSQPNDNGCNGCHDSRFANPLSPIDGHIHPFDRPSFDAGLNVSLTALSEAGTNDGDGTLDPGEKLALEFTLHNDAGNAVDPLLLNELRLLVAGPNSNFQVLYDAAVPAALVAGGANLQLTLPERLELEFVGDSTAGLDVFQSARFPHRLATGVTSEVRVRTGSAGGASVLRASAPALTNFVDVFNAAGFERGDTLVLDDGVAGLEEYLVVQLVDGRRLWFAAPNQPGSPVGLRFTHGAGALVREVQTSLLSAPLDYTLDPLSGTLSEQLEFGDGNAVLVSYTTDYVVPAVYPQALNGSSDVTDQQGKWSGHALVGGTYVVSLSAARDLEFRQGTTGTPYRTSSPAATREFLVGDASALTPYTKVDGSSCEACHQRLSYHDNLYQGFDTCILCHGASGTEDLPRYVAANAPETRKLSVEFRNILHRIHRGQELGDEDFRVAVPGPGVYPDNFAQAEYHEFSTLPSQPERTLDCARCHGTDNTAALLPSARKHPTQQLAAQQLWRPVCTGCHDGEPAVAHVDSNTAPDGAEACAICHAPGEFEDVLAKHAARREPR
ncbi:MAG: hypothetical protein EXS08_08690 [Planctomycetes bacterium]|nr:hypothetical protein [Planctomycetota bacterium]